MISFKQQPCTKKTIERRLADGLLAVLAARNVRFRGVYAETATVRARQSRPSARNAELLAANAVVRCAPGRVRRSIGTPRDKREAIAL